MNRFLDLAVTKLIGLIEIFALLRDLHSEQVAIGFDLPIFNLGDGLLRCR